MFSSGVNEICIKGHLKAAEMFLNYPPASCEWLHMEFSALKAKKFVSFEEKFFNDVD